MARRRIAFYCKWACHSRRQGSAPSTLSRPTLASYRWCYGRARGPSAAMLNNPAENMLCHAMELALKAYLFHHGETSNPIGQSRLCRTRGGGEDARHRARHRSRGESGPGEGFPKHPLHRIVCIGALVASRPGKSAVRW
jgi:hypothetical protein